MDSRTSFKVSIWPSGGMSSTRRFNQSIIPYRVRQFWAVLNSTQPSDRDLAPARSVLTEQQMALFTRLQSSEQTHSLRVLKTLQDQGERHPDLLTAALLHDIGKIYHPLCIWERVIIVLAKRIAPKKMQAWGAAHPRGWKRSFVVAHMHPSWGAELAREAGTTPLAVKLIQNHQEVISTLAEKSSVSKKLLTTLQKADNLN